MDGTTLCGHPDTPVIKVCPILVVCSHIMLLFLYILFYRFLIHSITLRALAFTRYTESQPYSTIINQFNKYAKKKNLDISIELNLLTIYNSTFSLNDFGSMVEALFKKKNKYELYFYDNVYTTKYGKYLLNLKEWIPKNTLDLYDQKIISETCYYNEKLPVQLSYSVMYSNESYLKKYNKRIPKTWNELIETSIYILEKEKEKNNTNLVAYNGLLDDSEQGTYSLIDYIYSCREDKSSAYPDLRSQSSINALNMIKELKNKIGSDEIFSSNYYISVGKLFEPFSMLFTRFLIFQPPEKYLIPHKISPLPGLHEGVSSSLVCGFNIGISKYVTNERKNASLIALDYITSLETHKKFVLKELTTPFMPSLLDDEEVCHSIDCELFKSFQYIGRQINKNSIYDFDTYSDKYRNYIYEFLYGNKMASDVLKKVEDITKIYYVSLNTKDSAIGLVSLVIISFLSLIMILSLIFLFKEFYIPFFEFLSIDFWILIIIGLILISSICFTKFDLIINGLLVATPYMIKNIMVEDGQNFQMCTMNNIYGKILVSSPDFIKIIIVGIMLILIFSEWNIQSTLIDMRLILASLYINIICIIIITIIKYVKFNSYKIYFTIKEFIYLTITISNYLILYGIRLLTAFMENWKIKSSSKKNKNNLNKNIIAITAKLKNCRSDDESSQNNNKSYYESKMTNDNSNNSNFNSARVQSFFVKIMNCHYSVESNSYNSSHNYNSNSENKSYNTFESTP
ncbi:hypothetical protein U3516DRAFT_653405 [Neocallimastix sp. 'constans']